MWQRWAVFFKTFSRLALLRLAGEIRLKRCRFFSLLLRFRSLQSIATNSVGSESSYARIVCVLGAPSSDIVMRFSRKRREMPAS